MRTNLLSLPNIGKIANDKTAGVPYYYTPLFPPFLYIKKMVKEKMKTRIGILIVMAIMALLALSLLATSQPPHTIRGWVYYADDGSQSVDNALVTAKNIQTGAILVNVTMVLENYYTFHLSSNDPSWEQDDLIQISIYQPSGDHSGWTGKNYGLLDYGSSSGSQYINVTIYPPAGAPCRKGDVDKDGDIDIFDFYAFAQSWGSQTGQPAYNVCMDFDDPPDGDVDIFDLDGFAQIWGTTYCDSPPCVAPPWNPWP